MRIALTGAHGTGKTTLLKGLQEKLPHYVVQLESLTRTAVSSSKELNFGTTRATQEAVVAKYIEKFSNMPENYISPRCLIDVLAYTKQFVLSDEVDANYFREQLNMTLEETKKFDLIVYVPISFEQKESGEYREGQLEHPEYQQDIDNLIRQIMYLGSIKYITVSGNTIEEKVNSIYNKIKERDENNTSKV